MLYFRTVLNFSDSNSTVFFHLFASICYFTPILGAILADSKWGRFKTILYLSIVYLFGELILIFSSVIWNRGTISIATTFSGLLLIALGTGGIKPCICALGGDQFLAHEEKWRQSFFSMFYFALNMGALISMFLTPMLRSEFQCVGRVDCYPLAFGVPCALMAVAIVVFLLARNKYHLEPLPEENVLVAFCKCVWLAGKRKLMGYQSKSDNKAAINKGGPSIVGSNTSSDSNLSMYSGEEVLISASSLNPLNQQEQKRKEVVEVEKKKNKKKKKYANQDSHWLYLAADRFDTKSIEDFKAVLKILLITLPQPIYWCLFDQQSSLWTLQANRMNGRLFNTGFVLEPDQLSVANPLMILAFIPIFEIFIYPCLKKCKVNTKPIARMTVGGLIAALAFVFSSLIELRIQQYLPPTEPTLGHANLLLVNGLSDCSLLSPAILETTPNMTDSQQLISSRVYPTLQPLKTQTIELLSSNSSLLIEHNYQLKFKLSSSNSSTSENQVTLTSSSCPFNPTSEFKFNLAPLPDKSVRLLYIQQANGKLETKMFNDSLSLPVAGRARVRLIYEAFGSSAQVDKRQFSLVRPSTTSQQTNNKTSLSRVFTIQSKEGQIFISDYIDVEVPTKGELFLLQTNDGLLGPKNNQSIFLKAGTRNLIVVHQKDASTVEVRNELLQDNDYRISMLYQLVPYALISASEVLFSITGLEFCYSMAPDSMRSVIMALWSSTTAFGNILIVAVESIHFFPNVAHDFLFYASIMALDMVVFAYIGYNLKPYKGREKTIKKEVN